MKYALLILCLLIVGCAQTTVYRNGQPILKTQANAKLLVFRQGDTFLRIEGMNHSGPTLAGAKVIANTMTGATGIATAILAKGFVP